MTLFVWIFLMDSTKGVLLQCAVIYMPDFFNIVKEL